MIGIDINIPSDEWISINTIAGIALGTKIYIQNKGSQNILVVESDTIPDATSQDGRLISRAVGYGNDATITSPHTLWARAVRKNTTIFTKIVV